MYAWCSGTIPATKEEEDKLMALWGKKSGKIGEIAVEKLLKKAGLNPLRQKFDPSEWLLDQGILWPDMVCENLVFEVKTLQYFSERGRGNQGTAPEKLDSVFRKYCGLVDKGFIIIIVLCADMQNDKNGKALLDAFNKGEYHGNKQNELNATFWKGKFFVKKFQDITKDFLYDLYEIKLK
jgi:hypothetical protein